ncbi:MAG: hypothetical protein ABIJ34_06140 [archaeon]
MKKLIYLVMLVILLGTAIAQENIFFDDSYLGPTSIVDGIMDATVGDKILSIDLESFNEYDMIISEYNESPVMTINYSDQLISIMQISREKTIVMLGKPEESLLESSIPVVYLVEHYSPDAQLSDPSREKGEKRITVVVKDAEVEVHNKIIARTDGLKIATRSFLEASDLSGKEIDMISKENGFEIFSDLKSLLISSFNYTINRLFDRGFSTFVKKNMEVDLNELEFIDVLNESVASVNRSVAANSSDESIGCSKFGFKFLPGYGYEFVSETSKFTKGNGWALGIAEAHDDHFEASITDMSNFLIYSATDNLTPIVRILGNNKMNQVESADSVVSFVQRLKQESNGKLKFVQIWDKPNVDYDADDYFAYPQNYADYVIEVKNKLNDPSIKIIAGSLSIGENGWIDGHFRNNSIEYLDVLLRIPEFWDAIDYWGSSSYDMEYIDNYCIFTEGTSLIEQESMCLKSIYAYTWENEKIAEAIGNVSIILTDVGYVLTNENMDNLEPLLTMIRDEMDIEAAIISSANGWENDDAWLTENNNKLESFALPIALKVC